MYHNIENLEALSKNKIIPLISKFNENLVKMDGMSDLNVFKKEIRNFKKHFENSLQNEKSQTLKIINEIKQSLNQVYNQYSTELDQLKSSTKLNLEKLDSNLQSYNQIGNSLDGLNKIISNTNLQKTRKKDFFILQIIHNFEELNNIKFTGKSSLNVNFSDTFNSIKTQCKSTFDAILEGKFISDLKIQNLKLINFFYTNIKKQNVNNNQIILGNNNNNNMMDNSHSNKNLIRSSIGGKEKNVGI